jgi:outer membrane receptor protein involved in Fe transport
VFVQDEISLARHWTATVGIRGDWWSLGPNAAKPRAGLVYRTDSDTAFKVLYGEAFRAPNVYELYYDQLGSASNPDLGPETVRTTEVVFEQYLSRSVRLTVAGFYTDIDDLIDQIDDEDGNVLHANAASAKSTGIELEAEHRSATGILTRGSLVFQRASDGKSGRRLSNAPASLATFDLAIPIAARQATIALDSRFVGPRLTLSGRSLDAVVLTDVITTWQPRTKRFTLQAGVYNVLDRDFADPVGGEFVQESIPQDGRTAAIKLGFRF